MVSKIYLSCFLSVFAKLYINARTVVRIQNGSWSQSTLRMNLYCLLFPDRCSWRYAFYGQSILWCGPSCRIEIWLNKKALSFPLAWMEILFHLWRTDLPTVYLQTSIISLVTKAVNWLIRENKFNCCHKYAYINEKFDFNVLL